MRIQDQVPLAKRTTLGVGGRAEYLVEATDETEVVEALDWAARYQVPCRVLGGGSNVVIADGGFNGLVIHIATRGVVWNARPDSVEVTAAAGEMWDSLVADSVRRGYAGLECLSGIPGQVGATPIQNVGAYGQEVADSIVRVRAFDRELGQSVVLPASDCEFGYRNSRFKSVEPGRFVVLSVTFQLGTEGGAQPSYPQLARHLEARGVPSPTARDVRESVLSIRREKSMLADPDDPNGRSCGSFFVNPVVSAELAVRATRDFTDAPSYPQPDGRVKLAAAWLIEQAGFPRGHRQGHAGLSARHALALVDGEVHDAPHRIGADVHRPLGLDRARRRHDGLEIALLDLLGVHRRRVGARVLQVDEGQRAKHDEDADDDEDLLACHDYEPPIQVRTPAMQSAMTA